MTSTSTSPQYEALDTDDPESPSQDVTNPSLIQADQPEPDSRDGGDRNKDAPADTVDDTADATADNDRQQENDDDEGDDSEVAKDMCCWMYKTDVLIYCSQALSAWGDRMWTFAVALFLVELEDNSLRLTAIYGFALAISVLVLGALVGRWVDRTSRLKAVRTALLSQNSFVIVCAIIFLFLLRYKDWLLEEWYPGLYLLCMLVILLGVIANLFSLAQKICIQKDWVVVVAGHDREKLAKMNAAIRRIDLSVNILAPIIVGLIMNFASMMVAALFIAGWNIMSMIAEYFLLLKVYRDVPALARKGESGDAQATPRQDTLMTPQDENEDSSPPQDVENGSKNTPEESTACCTLHQKIHRWFTSTHQAWLTYQSYTVSWAGMGMALFYMTVMGFDSITNGFGYSIGVPEYMIGVMRALGSVAGIVGTLIFPVLHRKVGLERTGLYAVTYDICCLSLCIASIWAPGSPFDPYYYQRTDALQPQATTPLNYYVVPSTLQNYIPDKTSPLQNGGDLLELTNSTAITDFVTAAISGSFSSSLVTTPLDIVTPTASVTDLTAASKTRSISGQECIDYIGVEKNYWTAALFFGGMILSRMGLWTFDLVVTQSIQENIKETERGVFNGVQRSLECSMDMLHFILVIFLPCPATFGFLIILSVMFVITGSLLFSVYSYKVRGHLFHPEKFTVCAPHENGGSAVPNGDAVENV